MPVHLFFLAALTAAVAAQAQTPPAQPPPAQQAAVLDWLESEGATPSRIHDHAMSLQARFLGGSPALGDLVIDDEARRGNFLTFRSDRAGDLYQRLHEKGVITDFRSDRLRIGFGVYQDEADVDRLLDAL